MARNTYDWGDLVHIVGTFTDANGTAQDPTSVYFSYVTPAGVVSHYTYNVAQGAGVATDITRSGTGIYWADVKTQMADPGDWFYRVHASGTGQAAADGWFSVKRSKFA